ncbi:MAG: alpha/beta fold hydrolase [Acidimicrobiia bacterium]
MPDVTFPSGDLTLAGTLALPDGDGPFPAAVLVTGSGPLDRDSNTKKLRIDVMAQVATHLAAHGIASLRYDKRGVGESEGDYLAAGLFDNVADARAALAALRERAEVDADRLFVIGHSEGALIATEVAATEDLAGAVLLAGSAQLGRTVIEWQAAQVAEDLPTAAKVIMKVLRQDVAGQQRKTLDRLEATTDDVARIQFQKLNAKWFREFLAHDPTESLARVRCPVLAITGAKDVQVPPADVELMRGLVPTAFTGEVPADVTHLLRRDPGPPSVRSYKQQAKRPVDRGVLATISGWIGPVA